MNQERQILNKWAALENDTGLDAAKKVVRLLDVCSVILLLLMLSVIYFNVSNIVLCLISVIFGWVVAERNALSWRIKQWPVIRKYLDWASIRNSENVE